MRDLGWEDFFNLRRGRGNFSDLGGLDHPACRLLRQYWHRGPPVVSSRKWWTEGQWRAALDRGPHQSTMAHVPFLREDFASMVGKGKWVVLP